MAFLFCALILTIYTICTAFFRSVKFTCVIIIFPSLVKDFLSDVKITTQNHQSDHKFKYAPSTSHARLASQLAQKDPPLFPLHKKIRRHRTKMSTSFLLHFFPANVRVFKIAVWVENRNILLYL